MLVMCTHLARSVALRTCSGNTLAQPEVPDKHAFATSGAARGYVGMRGAGHTRPDDHLKQKADTLILNLTLTITLTRWWHAGRSLWARRAEKPRSVSPVLEQRSVLGVILTSTLVGLNQNSS